MNPIYKLGTVQEVATAATSATTTNAFGSQTYALRLSCTQACRVKVVEAAGGAAAATDTYLPANVVDYIACAPGQKLSAIRETADGKLTVTELTK